MIQKPTPLELDAINMRPIQAKCNPRSGRNIEFIGAPAGLEHYRLLAWLGYQLEPGSSIVEIGTLDGCGSLSLAHNADISVTTWDIEPHWHRPLAWPENITANIVADQKDWKHLEKNYPGVLDADLIFYDAAHEGKQEREFISFLEAKKWKGFLVLDDIHLNPEMDHFWFEIKQPKENWTDVGHWSGTGIVRFL